MTLKEARKVLGKLAVGISDEALLGDIETAEMLRNLFFNNLIKERDIKPKTTGLNSLKVP